MSLHIPNETAPPGGMVQMKFMVTEPTPISSGKPVLGIDTSLFDSVDGIEVFNPYGDVNGIALQQGSKLSITYTTSTGAFGTDYPIMSIAMHVRPDATIGSQTLFNLDPSSTWTEGYLGTTTYKPAPPATITVGGSISILNVVPGGGMLPAGSVVSIRGMGFQPKTQVQLNAIKFSSISIVSANEIRFTLAADTNMTGQKIQVVNPDGSQDTYFSYMRGVPLGAPARAFLAGAVPIFSAVTHSWAAFAPLVPLSGSQFTGFAVQNPNLSPASVTVSLYSPLNALLGSSTTVVPAGYRMVREISEFAQGAAPVFGSYVVVTSTLPTQAFGFAGDEATAAFAPFAAVLSRP